MAAHRREPGRAVGVTARNAARAAFNRRVDRELNHEHWRTAWRACGRLGLALLAVAIGVGVLGVLTVVVLA